MSLKDHIRSVRGSVFIEEQNIPLEIDVDGNDESYIHFVVYDNRTPIGTARLRHDGLLGRVAVLSKNGNQGIGKLLIKSIEDHARSLNIASIYFHAQITAVKFYIKFGYKTIGEVYQEAGIDHISMEKHI